MSHPIAYGVEPCPNHPGGLAPLVETYYLLGLRFYRAICPECDVDGPGARGGRDWALKGWDEERIGAEVPRS